MRILWITAVRFGETIHQWGQLGTAGALKDRGVRIDFLSPKIGESGQSILEEFNFGHIPLNYYNIPGTYFISVNRNISKLLMNQIELDVYDAVICEWQTSLGLNSAFRKLKKKGKSTPPWIFEDRSPPAKSSFLSLLQGIQYQMSWKIAANSADSVEVLVPGLERYIRQKFDFKKRMIHCPSGADLSRFTPNKSTSLHLPLRLLHHGSLDKGRGLKRIIDLGIELENRKIQFQITLFGSGPMSGYFQDQSEKYDWFRFLGKIPFDSVPDEINRHDIGLLPLPKRLPWDVGSPLKAMEYAASGLCVLATDVDGSIPLEKFDWFFVSPSESPVNQWIESIYRIKESDLDLKKQARLDAEKELSWKNASRELYTELVKISSPD